MCDPLVPILPALLLALPLAGVASCLADGSNASTPTDGAEGRTAADTGAPSGYAVLASEGLGRTLFALKSDARSAKAAALAALRDLGRVFDDKPLVGGAFGDVQDKQCRGWFTARLKGQPIKGFVASGVGGRWGGGHRRLRPGRRGHIGVGGAAGRGAGFKAMGRSRAARRQRDAQASVGLEDHSEHRDRRHPGCRPFGADHWAGTWHTGRCPEFPHCAASPRRGRHARRALLGIL